MKFYGGEDCHIMLICSYVTCRTTCLFPTYLVVPKLRRWRLVFELGSLALGKSTEDSFPIQEVAVDALVIEAAGARVELVGLQLHDSYSANAIFFNHALDFYRIQPG